MLEALFAVVQAAHILTKKAEIELWMAAPAEDALKLQRPLVDGALKIVATGERKDEAA